MPLEKKSVKFSISVRTKSLISLHDLRVVRLDALSVLSFMPGLLPETILTNGGAISESLSFRS